LEPFHHETREEHEVLQIAWRLSFSSPWAGARLGMVAESRNKNGMNDFQKQQSFSSP